MLLSYPGVHGSLQDEAYCSLVAFFLLLFILFRGRFRSGALQALKFSMKSFLDSKTGKIQLRFSALGAKWP
jgi:hypothetical protein